MEAVKKCSNLVLPKGFVELDREEMTYVDGGVSLSYNKIWWFTVGFIISLTKLECADIAAICAMGVGVAGIAAAIAGYCSAGIGALIGGIIAGVLSIASGWCWYCSNGNGMQIKTIGLNVVSIRRL